MSSLKVALMPICMRIEDPYEAIRTAASFGADGVQISVCPGGHFSLKVMTAAKCKEVAAFVHDQGLEISATSGDAGDLGDPSDKAAKLENARRSLEVAAELGCGIWQTHIGVVPSDHDDPRWETYVDMLSGIGAIGEQIGASIANETGPEPPRVLAELLQEVGSDAIRINFDPANLIIWPAHLAEQNRTKYDKEKAMAECDPVAGARLLAPYIVHTHAKDAMVDESDKYHDVPLGEGWVDWPAYVATLKQAGYDGFFAIEREAGENPAEDMRKAVGFLRTL